MFKRYVDKLKSEDPLCPLCRRTFDSNDDVNLVIEDVSCEDVRCTIFYLKVNYSIFFF